MKKLFDLTAKTAVITGGAGLIGRKLAEGLASFGAKVWIADLDPKKAQRAAVQMRARKLKVQPLYLDISNDESINAAIKKVTEHHNSLDIWINNAYPRTGDWGTRLEKIPESSWRLNIDQHLNGYCLCSRKAAEAMKKQKKGGSIINMASIYGIVAPDFSVYKGTSMTSPGAYAAIKGGILQFTRYLASYYGPHRIRINAISPGGVLDHQSQFFVQRYAKKTPMRRMALAEDIVGAAVYLASDASAYVTGHNLVVDGGWSII